MVRTVEAIEWFDRCLEVKADVCFDTRHCALGSLARARAHTHTQVKPTHSDALLRRGALWQPQNIYRAIDDYSRVRAYCNTTGRCAYTRSAGRRSQRLLAVQRPGAALAAPPFGARAVCAISPRRSVPRTRASAFQCDGRLGVDGRAVEQQALTRRADRANEAIPIRRMRVP